MALIENNCISGMIAAHFSVNIFVTNIGLTKNSPNAIGNPINVIVFNPNKKNFLNLTLSFESFE